MSEDRPAERSETRAETLVCAAIFILAVVVAVWLRFDRIGLKPFHHDEGVNSYFLLNLAHSGNYRYDPTNYHGPTLYYFALVALRIFGENDFALRLSPALFGLLTVALVWLLRRHLGAVGTPVAAFCLALSPCLVYFSRDFIHEMLFGCFSLGTVVGAWRYAEDKKFRWLALAAVSAGLLFATKETAIVNVTVMVIAILCAAVWDATRSLIRQRQFTPAAMTRDLRRDVAAILPSLDHLLAAIIIFVFINVIFYSSLFTNMKGVRDAVESVVMWQRRSGSEHVKTFWYYIGILVKLELPLLLGSLLAAVIVVWRGTRFWLFAAAWALGTALAYSIIGYKTPWLMISFVVPMALICGYAAEQMYRLLPVMPLRLVWGAIVAVALIACGRMAWKVNFKAYDDNGNKNGYFAEAIEKRLVQPYLNQPAENSNSLIARFFRGRGRDLLTPYLDGTYGYVYAQTDRALLGLVNEIKRETDKLPTKDSTGIYVASPEYWPLPWYLRDYKTQFAGKWPVAAGEPLNISEPIIIANVNQQSSMDGISGWHRGLQAYTMRPGVELVLFIRDESVQP
jgi:uncharacterized protein (TIGR03663 family)